MVTYEPKPKNLLMFYEFELEKDDLMEYLWQIFT